MYILAPKMYILAPKMDILTENVHIKGLVRPKMKILSVFTHPHVVPNLDVFICSAEHKGRHLEECFNRQISFPIDYRIFSYYGNQWGLRSV